MKFSQLLCCLSILFWVGLTWGQSNREVLQAGTKIQSTKHTLNKKKKPILEGESISTAASTGTIKAIANVDAGSTAAELDVSPSGGVTYTVPIKIPAGIKDFAPAVSLSYNGQGTSGIAGYGWNIAGLSSITRIASSVYHDNYVNPVDFDSNDRYLFDGQRLMLKSGTYGASGSEYATETHSNIKIKAFGTSPLGAQYGPAYFVVYHPDGTQSYYGNGGNSHNRMEWAIFRVIDPQGNRIEYSYLSSDNLLRINQITYGGRNGSNMSNRISFVYKTRARAEHRYIGNTSFTRKHTLSRIETYSGSTLFRKFDLSHSITSLGYEIVNSITETNGQGKSLSPITFNYDASSDYIQPYENSGDLSIFPGVDYKKHAMSSGEFSGDGKMDLILYNKTNPSEFHLFSDITSGNNTSIAHSAPVGRFKKLFPSTILTHNGQVFWKDAITTVVESTSGIKFRSFISDVTGIYHQYDKTWNAPTYFSQFTCNQAGSQKVIPKEYISGDFNGDGLTDVLAIQKSYSQTTCFTSNPEDCDIIIAPYENKSDEDDESESADSATDKALIPIEGCCDCNSTTVNSKTAYLIDLNRQMTSNFATFAGNLISNINSNDRLIPSDFDGDGKTDLFHFSEGKLEVYTLNEQNRLTRLYLINDTTIKMNYPILFGDYNGDGKVDFTIPTANKSRVWKFFMGTGNRITSYTKDINVWFGEGGISTQGHVFEGEPLIFGQPTIQKLFEYHYIAQDYNGDGKTDILSHHVITPVSSSNYVTEKLSLHINRATSSSTQPYFEPKGYRQQENNGLTKFGIPVFLDLNKQTANLEYAYVDGNKIYGFEFAKDHRRDILLKSVSNNGLSTTVEYDQDRQPWQGSIYTASFNVPYPYVEAPRLDGLPIVRRLVQKGSGLTRYKQFYYTSAVSHMQGLGFMGFQLSHRSNWFGDGVNSLWQSTRQDYNKRGAISEQWTATSAGSSASNYISRTVNTYNTSIDTKKVFSNTLSRSVTEDKLTDITTTRTIAYDQYFNPVTTRTTHNDGYTELKIQYFNNPSASDATYHIGRPKEQTETKNLKGQTFKTTDRYTYANNLLTRLEKQGNGTETIVYTYGYDAYGNIVRKESPGTSGNWVETYTYDTTGKYMLSATDHLGLKTTYTYNTILGTVASMVDPYGLKTTYEYDGWNRLTQSKDYLNHTTLITYLRQNDGGTLTKTDYPQGNDEWITTNTFGWPIHKMFLSRNNKYIRTSYKYDVAGKVKEESEPHFSNTSANQWNKIYYDAYGRVINQTLYNGKQIATSYSGLTVTVDDGVKTVSTTMDAIGNVSSVTDAGGTIRYDYYANGLMKTANYDSYKIEVSMDQWGRKTSMQDPSAGNYIYRYNKIGQLLEETSPQGKTVFTYNSNGTLMKKSLSGAHTSMNINYVYDNKFRNTSISASGNANQSFNYTYTYDSYNRLNRVTENVNGSEAGGSYEKGIVYDSYGRPFTETYSSTNQMDGTNSTVKVDHYYDAAGNLTEILDVNTKKVLWKVNSETARQQTLSISLGNGFTKTRKFDNYGNLTEVRDYKTVNGVTTTAAFMNYDFDVSRGILKSRENKIFNSIENFEHDNLDRLTKISGAINQTQSYGPRGRIGYNSFIGKYSYRTSSPYQLDYVDLNNNDYPYFKVNHTQSISYNAFKKPVEIRQTAVETMSYDYGPFMNRIKAYYGNTDEDKAKRPFRRLYSSIIPVEIIHNKNQGATKIITYIGGDQYTAPVSHIKEVNGRGTNGFHYIHRDYLGSVLALTNDNGVVVEKNHFGAWGNLDKQSTTLTGVFAYDKFILGRGYTGHEHMAKLDLMHMNGRIYDIKLHRFLSPDNFVQDPFNTQSFNRFGYVWNNPLSYSDPSGEIIPFIIAGAMLVGAFMGAAQANGTYNPLKWDWSSGKTWGGIIGGAVIGGISAGVGIVAAPIVGGLLTSVGITGGILGGAITGLVSGAVSGFISGGLMTQLPGGDGNFWRGAVNGAVTGAVTGAIVGGIVGGVTTPKGANPYTGRMPKPSVSVASELTPNGFATADDALTIRGEGIPNTQPAAQPPVTQPTATNTSASVTRTLNRAPDGKLSGNLNLQAVDDLTTNDIKLLGQGVKALHKHHILPQKFKAWFVERGISNIDDFTVQISPQNHLKGVHGKGLGNMPGKWNNIWAEFIKTTPNATPSQIFYQAETMLKRFGLEHLRYVKY